MDTVADLYLHIQREVGDQGAIFINTDDVLRWANQGVVDIIRKAELDNYFISTLAVAKNASTITIAVGSGKLYRVEYLRIGTDQLTEVDLTELEMYVPNFDLAVDVGMPNYYWITSETGVINIYPKADIAYTATIRASLFKPKYTALGDLLNVCLPESYKYDLLQFCLVRGYARSKDHQSEEAANKEYMQNLTLRYGEAKSKSAEFDTIQADEYDGYPVLLNYGDL